MPLVPASTTSGCAGRPAGVRLAQRIAPTITLTAQYNQGFSESSQTPIFPAEWRVIQSSAAVPVIELNRAVSLMHVNAKQSRSGAQDPTADPHRRAGEPAPRSHYSFGIKNRSIPNDWWFLLRRTGRAAAGKARGRGNIKPRRAPPPRAR